MNDRIYAVNSIRLCLFVFFKRKQTHMSIRAQYIDTSERCDLCHCLMILIKLISKQAETAFFTFSLKKYHNINMFHSNCKRQKY